MGLVYQLDCDWRMTPKGGDHMAKFEDYANKYQTVRMSGTILLIAEK